MLHEGERVSTTTLPPSVSFSKMLCEHWKINWKTNRCCGSNRFFLEVHKPCFPITWPKWMEIAELKLEWKKKIDPLLCLIIRKETQKLLLRGLERFFRRPNVMLKRPKIRGSPSRSPVQFLLLLISGLLNWRGFQSLNYWVYIYRTISSGIHMSQA